MASIGNPLQRGEREAIASFLGTAGEDVSFPSSAFCSQAGPAILSTPSANWMGWSPTFANTRFQSTEAAGLTAAQVPNLKLKWAFGFPGDITAFGASTIRSGTLFTGSASGTVYAINAKTGCLYWTFQANGPVRSAPLIVENGTGYSLAFGDQIGWFYLLDASHGKLLWRQRIDDHEATKLTGSPAFNRGILFIPAASWEENRTVSSDHACCTFRGSITALRVSDGSLIWKTYLVEPAQKTGVTANGGATFGPSGAPVWSTPTVDEKRDALYVTTGDNYSMPATSTSDAVVALQLKTGQILWSRQVTLGDVWNRSCDVRGPNCQFDAGPDFDFGSSALLVSVGGRELLIAGQKSGLVYAFDPDQKGKILWQVRVGKGGTLGGVQWGMTSDDKTVYASVSDVVRKQLVADAKVGGTDFDPIQGGGLTALQLNDGKKIWFAPSYPCTPPRSGCSPAQSAALTCISGAVFSGSLDGHLRAFSTEDGHLLWDFDTVRNYIAVNGVPAKGGSIDGAGPVVVDGMLYVNSGYPRLGGMPGNVLLAFSVDGK
jgi:polyvinyl alcohol dehydrogenase (cytochrome)